MIYIPDRLARNLPPDWQERARCEPFVGLVAGANGLPVHKAIQTDEAVAAPAAIAALLEMVLGVPLLKLQRTFFARPGTALEHAQVYCRPDRYRQIIEFRSGGVAPERELA